MAQQPAPVWHSVAHNSFPRLTVDPVGRSALLVAMNVDLGIWAKLTKIVVFLLFVAGVLAVAVWYLPLIRHNEALRKELLGLEARIQKEEETGRQLKNSIDALRYDPKEVEREVRRRWGYAKPGEIVVRFEGTGTEAQASSPLRPRP